jgi:hypothetical protein
MPDDKSKNLNLIWGAREIAAALNISERKAFHLLESNKLPAKKIGGSWVMPRKAIGQIFSNSAAAWLMSSNGKRRPLVTDGAEKIDQLGGSINSLNNRNIPGLQINAVRAEIINSDECSAEGLLARGNAPVLGLCRELIKAGFDPGRPLHAYRGATLCLIVRSIGQGARLTVAERPNGPTFEAWKPFSTPAVAPPMRQNLTAGAALWESSNKSTGPLCSTFASVVQRDSFGRTAPTAAIAARLRRQS